MQQEYRGLMTLAFAALVEVVGVSALSRESLCEAATKRELSMLLHI